MNTPPIFGSAIEAIEGGREETRVTGLWGSSKALFLWELACRCQGPILAVSPTAKEAEALFKDYGFFFSQAGKNGTCKKAAYFPPWDVLPYDVVLPDPSVVSARLKVLGDLKNGAAEVVVAPVKAILHRLPDPEDLLGEGAVLKLARGMEVDRDALIARLDGQGYGRASMVYEPGEFSVRGGIVDIYPPGADAPVRVEFMGDTVESLRAFDPDTQRSIRELQDVAVLPAKEGPDAPAAGSRAADITAYFKDRPLIVLDEPERVYPQARDFEERAFTAYADADGDKVPRPEEIYIPEPELSVLLARHRRVSVESMPLEGPDSLNHRTRSIEGLRLREVAPEPWPEDLPRTPVSIFCRNLRELKKNISINVVSSTPGQAERIREIFAEYGLPAASGPIRLAPPGPGPEGGVIQVTVGEPSSGFLLEEPGLALITAAEIFGEKPRHAPAPRAKVERFLTSLSELSPGDYVVHVEHGIGRYMGLRRLKLLGVEGDFLEIVYQGSDRLYVPVDELGKVQKYIGAEGASAGLDKLGGVMWERTKARAKKAVEEMARDLLDLYAARSVAPGFAYSPDDHLFREMEAAFEFDETPDQARAIDDVKKDLETPHPMDRLVCGDVGYGKTEVAIRACFKAVLDGKQAAVLVPTTLLASQHFETFSARLAAFPVRVEMLSRFTHKARQKEVVKGLAGGAVDIVIGTHRLLQKDVSFKDLGLIVIDEEHRFGVAHKEKLKKMRKQVDVLTLTATPIPRTLHMSITGIRDLSIIETPPPDRLPIKTIVTRFDKSVIREAVSREMMRGGQVFFVHNRIESIYAIGEMLKGMLPEARIGVAHGRMAEDALEKVMTSFISGGLDILLTTSIIESGLDIPSANTIIINRADRFGLADLYQLRGRVGRSRLRAYAYLLVPGEETLSSTAQKRLRVLSELTGLGAGLRLAMHDLEIRGAGNVLGAEQSGHIAAVGFELYTHLLENAVKELKGEEVEERVDPAMDLKVSAYIPEEYVPDTAHRLGIYKRLAGAGTGAELADLKAELADRYGPVPGAAKRLVEVMELKVLARALNAAGVQLLPNEIKVSFTNRVAVSPDRLLGYLRSKKGAARYVPEYTVFIKRPGGGWDETFLEIKNFLKALA